MTQKRKTTFDGKRPLTEDDCVKGNRPAGNLERQERELLKTELSEDHEAANNTKKKGDDEAVNDNNVVENDERINKVKTMEVDVKVTDPKTELEA